MTSTLLDKLHLLILDDISYTPRIKRRLVSDSS